MKVKKMDEEYSIDKIKLEFTDGKYLIYKRMSIREIELITPLINEIQELEKNKNQIPYDKYKTIFGHFVTEHNIGDFENVPLIMLEAIFKEIMDNQSIQKK